jgi:hypothetical protein
MRIEGKKRRTAIPGEAEHLLGQCESAWRQVFGSVAGFLLRFSHEVNLNRPEQTSRHAFQYFGLLNLLYML